jgi:hypothetical protein
LNGGGPHIKSQYLQSTIVAPNDQILHPILRNIVRTEYRDSTSRRVVIESPATPHHGTPSSIVNNKLADGTTISPID